MTDILKIDPLNPEEEIIKKAGDILKRGGLVAFPTETVYGLGADMSNKNAIEKLRKVKNRLPEKPFTIHIANLRDLDKFECSISGFAGQLVKKFWPGPLTLIFDANGGNSRLGFRFPSSKVAQELIKHSGKTIVAPSANLSGGNSPKDASSISGHLKKMIDLILDAGPTQFGKESTVIDFTVFPYKILREGAIPKNKIAEAEFNFWKEERAPAIKKIVFVCTGNSCRSIMAEGYLKDRLKKIGRDTIKITSFGVGAFEGAGATPEAIGVMKNIGVDISSHRSKPLSDEEILDANLILVMEEFHKKNVLNRYPTKKEDVYLLAEFGLWGGKIQNNHLEIPDPIGKPIYVYEDCLRLIKESTERLIKVLL